MNNQTKVTREHTDRPLEKLIGDISFMTVA